MRLRRYRLHGRPVAGIYYAHRNDRPRGSLYALAVIALLLMVLAFAVAGR